MVILSFVIYQYKPAWRKWYIYVLPALVGFFVKEPAIMIAPLLFIYIMLFEKKQSIAEWITAKGLNNLFSSLKSLLPLFLLAFLLVWLSKKMTPATFDTGAPSRFYYILTQPFVIVHNVNNFILPLNLSADTDWTLVKNIFDDRVITGSIFILTLVFVALYCSRIQVLRPITFGITWFLLALLPTSVTPLAEVLNDHRTFFPFIGLVIATAWMLRILVFRFHLKVENSFFIRFIFIAIPIGILVGHAYGTHRRNKVWNTSESLWYDVTVKSPNNGRGLMNYGNSQMASGNFSVALDYYERALKIWPTYSYIYVNMGVLKAAMGKNDEAEPNFKRALALNAGNPEAYYYYANWLKAQGRYKEAMEEVTEGLTISPGHIGNKQLHAELTEIIAHHGDPLAAMESAVNRNPTPENYLNLSLAYYKDHNYKKCIEAAKQALKLKPAYAEAYNNICSAQNLLGNYDEAIKAGQLAIKYSPGFELAKNNLRDALSRKSKIDSMVLIVRKQPSADNYINLSLYYYNMG